MYRNSNGGNSDVIIQLSNNLSNQIQNIRKEISDNSEKSRLEIESKLKIINKEISDFQISSKMMRSILFQVSVSRQTAQGGFLHFVFPDPL